MRRLLLLTFISDTAGSRQSANEWQTQSCEDAALKNLTSVEHFHSIAGPYGLLN